MSDKMKMTDCLENDSCIRKSSNVEIIILRLVEFGLFQSVLLSRDAQLDTDLKGQHFDIF